MKQFGPLLVVWGAAMATLLLTREIGTSLMFFGAFLALLYVATGRLSFPLVGLLLFAGGAPGSWRPTSVTSTPACSPGSTRSTTRSTTALGRQLPARAVALRAGRRAACSGVGFDQSLVIPASADPPIPKAT